MFENNNKITPVVLSGGFGTRLWPLSRTKLPKQFHKLYSKKSMLQETLLRVDKLNLSKPMIVCNDLHKFIVKDQMLEINKKCNILLEPYPKNTAPAITLATLLCKPMDTVLVLPADHYIADKEIFCEQIQKGIKHAKNGNIVVFGIKPLEPNTDYGYIEIIDDGNNDFRVAKFKGKAKYFKGD